MPVIKTQEEKSFWHKDAQPKRDSSIIQLILAYDLCGWRNGRIAGAVGMTESRVSIIRNSPLFQSQRKARWQELQEQVTGDTATKIVAGDPVELKIKALALRAVEVKEDLLECGKPEVRNSASSDLLDRAGYGAEKKKIKASIELSDKMAQRFERILQRRSAKLEFEVEQ